jgi:hypothetical protein
MALEALETLWGILDDIDTASDMAKENDAWYRKRVEALQKKRWDTMIETDGYKLKGGPVEALRQALAKPEIEPKVLVDMAVLAEREACAKVCENMERNGAWITKTEAAAAIRARGIDGATVGEVGVWSET